MMCGRWSLEGRVVKCSVLELTEIAKDLPAVATRTKVILWQMLG